MKERNVFHGTFAIERRYRASIPRVFATWSQPELKAQWFACHDEWQPRAYALDFRINGHEHVETGPAGRVHAFDASYRDIITNERIVYSYDMRMDSALISVSLATVEFVREGSGTRMIFTEQAAYLDGRASAAEREEGTRLQFDNLDRLLNAARNIDA